MYNRKALAAVALACLLAPVSIAASAEHVKPPMNESFPADEGRISVETGIPMQNLPFELHLDRSSPPASLAQLEAALYEALPQRHLAFIADYLGADGYRALRGRYRSPIDLRSALYAREIMAEAWRQWGFNTSDDPFLPLIECVGPRFSYYLTLRLGFRYIQERGSRADAASDILRANRQLAEAAQRLFEVCEQQVALNRSDVAPD
jgi:hypothetical protein